MLDKDLPRLTTSKPLHLGMSRRRFLSAMGATGAAMFLGACGRGSEGVPAGEAPSPDALPDPEVAGNTAAERALEGLRQLDLPPDFSITIFSEDLTILGPKVTQQAFEDATGIRLDIQEAPFLEYHSRVLTDATTRARAFDVVIMDTNRMGDLDAAGYLADLTPWVEKYKPSLDEMISPLNRVWPIYNGKYVGLPTDGDTWIFYYRRDLMEDPDEQAAFEDRYRRELTVPATWDEYNEVLEFFTRPEDDLYGAVEWRVRGVTYFWFFQRLWSAGGTYFDDDMSAAINSEAGIRALEDLKAVNRYLPPGALSHGYVETVEAMANGTAFSNITWAAAGKNVNDPETSDTVGLWGFATVPGYVIDGQPNPLTMSAPGLSCIVSDHTEKNKEACYLWAQWYTSPEILLEANKNLAGNTESIHDVTFDHPEMRNLFDGAGEWLDASRANLQQAVPDPILPGYTEYTQALEIEISEFMTGTKSAEEALDAAAEQWDRITESFGREEQQRVYRNFLDAYGV